MGICCNRAANQNEDLLEKSLKNLKLREMSYEDLKSSINMALLPELTDEFKSKLQEKNLSSFMNSLKTLSKENFLKICRYYFYDSDLHTNPKAEHQRIYFEKVGEQSNQNKSELIFNLYSLIKFNDNKIDQFLPMILTMEETQSISYSKLKHIMFIYVRNNLIVPSLALKEVSEDENISSFVDNDIKNMYTNENILGYVNTICEDFEKSKFQNDEDAHMMDSYKIKNADIKKIFDNTAPDFFDLFNLRNSFYTLYG